MKLKVLALIVVTVVTSAFIPTSNSPQASNALVTGRAYTGRRGRRFLLCQQSRASRTLLYTRSSKLTAKDLVQQAEDNHLLRFNVAEASGPFTAQKFASCWGRRPLLMRGGFDVDQLYSELSWPTWQDVALLGCDEDAESRLITHQKEDQTSWGLQLGPFQDEDIDVLLINNQREREKLKWTLVVNDVDRFYPPLADWIDDTFAFIPRWRRDDGQISLADLEGGIGPHVDNYDVFLVQMSGERKWQVGKRFLSVKEEYDSLVDGIDVRILSNWDVEISQGNVEDLILKPGDVLYLPPRVVHCGTAISDGCMTLSVGCRAPSANDMVSRLAEDMANSVEGCAVQRFTDVDLLEKTASAGDYSSEGIAAFASGEITQEAKEEARKLVKDAVAELIDNDDKWDEMFGRLVTESKRVRPNYPEPLLGPNTDYKDDNDREWRQSLGVWGDPKLAVKSVLEGRGAFYQAEGITFGYSLAPPKKCSTACTEKNETHHFQQCHRLFVDGKKYDVDANVCTAFLVSAISSKRRFARDSILAQISDMSLFPETVICLLEDLVANGYLYGCSDD